MHFGRRTFDRLREGDPRSTAGDAVLVRQATLADHARLIEIERSLSLPTDRAALIENAIHAGICVVSTTRDLVIGFAIFDDSFFGHTFIRLVVVHPEHRRRGAAAALISEIENRVVTEKLFTSTNKSNGSAQRLLEALRFVRSGVIENLDEGDPEVVYFKRIEPCRSDLLVGRLVPSVR